MTRIARVFPRRTKASPDDALAYFGSPDLFVEADEVHISVSFTWDMQRAEQLAEEWRYVAPVKLGDPAYEKKTPYSLTFEPGLYIKSGYTFTSRGCPRRCWFCGVWKRLNTATPIPNYPEGWNILDDNLLACPREHVESVFAMLRRQNRRVEFTGGLEALSLEDYQVDLLASLTPRPNMFFAYDPGDTFDTLESAARRLLEAGFTRQSHRLRCYVMIGGPTDTLTLAEYRLNQMKAIGFTPFAMLWRLTEKSQEKYAPGPDWHALRRSWVRPAHIHSTEARKRAA